MTTTTATPIIQKTKAIRDKFLIDAVGFNKIKCLPFTAQEIKEKVKEII